MNSVVIVWFTVLTTVVTVSAAPQSAPRAALYPLKSSRITNGEDAVPNAYPYLVALRWRYTVFGTWQHHCGGSIISREWVLTAAHCFTELHSMTLFNALAGKHDLNIEESTEQSRDIILSWIHPSYDRRGAGPHDIALAKVASPFDFNDFVAPIALPARNAVHSGDAVLTGWGSTSLTSTPVRPSVLQVATIPIIDTTVCWYILANAVGIPPLDTATLDNVCAGPLDDSRVSACSGDSGGPLAQTVDGNWELVGIVSWGVSPCGDTGVPSVFVRTSAYIDWIERCMNGHCLTDGFRI